jgi:hypothetical protein
VAGRSDVDPAGQAVHVAWSGPPASPWALEAGLAGERGVCLGFGGKDSVVLGDGGAAHGTGTPSLA